MAVLHGGATLGLTEEAREVVRVFEAELIGDMTNRTFVALEVGFDLLDDATVDVFLGGNASMLTHKVAKVVRRELKFIGTPCYGRQNLVMCGRREVVVEQEVDTAHDVAIAD